MMLAQRRASIVYADAQGIRLPVIDVTNAHFPVPTGPDAFDHLRRTYLQHERRNRLIPPPVMRWMLRSLGKKSRLARELFGSRTGFLDAITTYVMKLGADNLPPGFDTPADRRFAAAPHLALLRLRMAQIAALLAEGLEEHLASQRSRPLALVNIGGGPALDSLNALILLKRQRHELLERPIFLAVLDIRSEGPSFGANALAALTGEGAPLAGLAVTFAHHRYDWNEPDHLGTLTAGARSHHAILAASSEGALFEYGSDDAIRGNLRALRALGVRLVAGSVTASDDARRRMVANSGLGIIPRGLEGFAPLATETGWTVARSETALLSHQVLLRPR
jgi:hypothetical protein